MNTKARKEHSELNREDWISHAYTPIEKADKKVGSDLSNAIHPMFSYELDELPHRATSKARWGKLTFEDYELLYPFLRLVTQLLESAPSCDAICSIAYGHRNPSPENIVHSGVPVFEFHKHNLPPFYVREAAGKVLKRLGKSIRFHLIELEHSDDGANGHTFGVTRGFPQGIAVTDRPQDRGVASMVLLDLKFLTMLKELLVETLGKQFQILKLYFEMANTLCHEIMHAINLASASELLNQYLERGDHVKLPLFAEPFYQGQNVAELGYFWENHVFGGACNQSVPIREDPVYIAEWPSWIFRDQDEQPEKHPPKRRALKWLVSAYYIKNIQTQEFWNRINAHHSQDLFVLRIRKRVAVKCFIPFNYMDYDETWDPDAPENKLGNSLRVPFTDDDPTPGARLANETHDEREERLDRERRMLPPGRDLEFLSRVDPLLRDSH